MKLVKRKILVSSKREIQNWSLKWYVNLYSEYLCESKFEENSQYKLGQAIWILLFTFFWLVDFYCDVTVTQINYPILNKQDNIEEEKGRSHKNI